MKHFILLLVVFLSACTNLQPKFEQAEINSGNLSLIKSKKVSFWGSEYFPWVHSVYDADGNKIVQMAAYADRINELYLRPGQYLVVLLCDRGNSYAHPSTAATLEAGKTYEASCEIGEVGKSILGFDTTKSLVAKVQEFQVDEN